MKRSRIALVVVAVAVVAAGIVQADHRGPTAFRAVLDGYQEVPAVSSTGSGRFRIRVVDGNSLEYALSYDGLEGAVTTASHVHLGQRSTNGGVIFFICGGGGRPNCTPRSGSFTGTVTATDVAGPANQGIAAAEFEEVVAALRAGALYVNVHTDKHPGGEIRGQINPHDD